MDSIKRLYTCPMCGNQKKPVEPLCETCLAQNQAREHTSTQNSTAQPPTTSAAQRSFVDLQTHIQQAHHRLQQQRVRAFSTTPIQHLSEDLQQKLVKRAEKQQKHYRSSGTVEPAITNHVPQT